MTTNDIDAIRKHPDRSIDDKFERVVAERDDLAGALVETERERDQAEAKIEQLRADLDDLRMQVYAQKPVIDAAEAWAEEWEGLKPDDAVPYAIAQPSAALHDAVEQYRLMDLALSTAREQKPEVES